MENKRITSEPYPKIQTVFKRDPNNDYKTLLINEYSLPEFEYLKDNEWIYTEKIDGTNIRAEWIPNNKIRLSFRGRTNKAEIPSHLKEKLVELFDIEIMKELFPDVDVYMYGEGYGYKVQKAGKKYLPNDVSFALFDIKINNWWLKREDVEGIAKALNIEIVPVIGTGTLKEMVGMAECGFRSKWGDFMAEGIVAKPAIDLRSRRGDRIITKIKHTDFEKG